MQAQPAPIYTAEGAPRASACLLVLCGLPGAGKTTLARSLADEAAREGAIARHVCFDELGCQPGGGGGGGSAGGSEASQAASFSPEAWQLARQHSLAVLEAELDAARSTAQQQQRQPASDAAAACGAPAGSSVQEQHMQQQPQQQQPQSSRQQYRLVIADDNMQYRSMRGQCYALARATAAAVVVLHVRCSEAVAQQRNAARPPGERVPKEVLARMAVQFEEPGSSSSSSGGGDAWERTCLVECNGAAAVDAVAVWRQVWHAWGPPAPPPFDAEAAAAAKAAAQAATAASLAHAVDVATRHVLSDCMQHLAAAGPQAKAAAAQELNAARRDLLNQLQQPGASLDAGEDVAAAAQRWAAAYRQQCDGILSRHTQLPG